MKHEEKYDRLVKIQRSASPDCLNRLLSLKNIIEQRQLVARGILSCSNDDEYVELNKYYDFLNNRIKKQIDL